MLVCVKDMAQPHCSTARELADTVQFVSINKASAQAYGLCLSTGLYCGEFFKGAGMHQIGEAAFFRKEKFLEK